MRINRLIGDRSPMTPKVKPLRDENGMLEDQKRLMQKIGIS
jgi:hypothetical protein